MTLDLSGITLGQFLIVLIGVSFIDLLSGVLSALTTHTWDWSKLPDYLTVHVEQRIFPIGALAFISQTLPNNGPQAVVFGAAVGFLALYVLETIQSIERNYNTPVATGISVKTTPVAKEPPRA